MDPTLLELAGISSTAILAAAATDAWQTMRSGVAGLLRRHGENRGENGEPGLLERLDEDAAALEAVAEDDRQAARDARAETLRTRLEDWLAERPQAAAELEALTARRGGPATKNVMHVNGHGPGPTYGVMFGTMNVDNRRTDATGATDGTNGTDRNGGNDAS
ncbi:hypothetical protein ACFWA6_24165 [Streptomyces sp. NPDC060020]|uniref:hypothetical protein n=1 Tax=Streptomyces sp. NPDC060020 TaxID=3347038 RepID=UPI0036B84708